jgi:hypothetical protein
MRDSSSAAPCRNEIEEHPAQPMPVPPGRLPFGFAWTAEAAVATWAVETLQSFLHARHRAIIRED